ncbi:MAG: hypothetical protein ACUZ8O_00720 [Candidatus Anammoxibacter sp.]
MNKKTFLNGLCNGEADIIQELLNLLNEMDIDYCVIDGLAVNAYVDPVVSLDLDIVVVIDSIEKLVEAVKNDFAIETFEHSINLNSTKSDIRIQLQTDKRYQEFIKKASGKDIMGYHMNVACLEDILQGKVWAYSDEQRRGSKRQKDLADIFRIIEEYSELKSNLPESIQNKIDENT